MGVMVRSVPATGCLCPEAVTIFGALTLIPETCPVLGVLALMAADGVVLGVMVRSVPASGCLCPEPANGLGTVVLTAVLGVEARGVPEGAVGLCDEVAATLGEIVLKAAGVVLDTNVAVPGRGVLGVPGLAGDVPTTLGEQGLTAEPGVIPRGVESLGPDVSPMFGGPEAVPPGVVALGMVEGLTNCCPVLTTAPGVPGLGMEDVVVNCGPCPEVVTTLGKLVRTPVEGLANLCAALTVDGVLVCAVDIL